MTQEELDAIQQKEAMERYDDWKRTEEFILRMLHVKIRADKAALCHDTVTSWFGSESTDRPRIVEGNPQQRP